MKLCPCLKQGQVRGPTCGRRPGKGQVGMPTETGPLGVLSPLAAPWHLAASLRAARSLFLSFFRSMTILNESCICLRCLILDIHSEMMTGVELINMSSPHIITFFDAMRALEIYFQQSSRILYRMINSSSHSVH